MGLFFLSFYLFFLTLRVGAGVLVIFDSLREREGSGQGRGGGPEGGGGKERRTGRFEVESEALQCLCGF